MKLYLNRLEITVDVERTFWINGDMGPAPPLRGLPEGLEETLLPGEREVMQSVTNVQSTIWVALECALTDWYDSLDI